VDRPTRTDPDENAVFLEILLARGAGFLDLQTGFLDEHGRDDEENEENEDDINKRRNIDLAVLSIRGGGLKFGKPAHDAGLA
jgi:hypothetical protein